MKVIAVALVIGTVLITAILCRAEKVEEIPASAGMTPVAGMTPTEVETQLRGQALQVDSQIVRPDPDDLVVKPIIAVKVVEPKYDFSDLSNWNLTVSAWERLAEKDYEGVTLYIEKCLELYEEEARNMAKEMRTFARLGAEDKYAVVNDVATCHYIFGEMYMLQKKPEEAIAKFELIIEEYPYAQCWDPKGWFWKVAEISKKNIEKINKQKETVGAVSPRLRSGHTSGEPAEQTVIPTDPKGSGGI